MSKDNVWLSNVGKKPITNDVSKNNLFNLTSNSKDPVPRAGVAEFHALST